MTIHDFDNWLIDQARNMPRAMNKGGTSQAQTNITAGDTAFDQLGAEGQAEQADVLPFLQSEMTNPAGFGTQGTNELLTAGGQATSDGPSTAASVGNAGQQGVVIITEYS